MMAAAEVRDAGLKRALSVACHLCGELVDLVEAARARVDPS